MAVADMKWMDNGLCREVDPDLFHPTKTHHTTNQAKAICNRCRVRDTCLSWALDHIELDGILGAATYKERLLLKKRRDRMVA